MQQNETLIISGPTIYTEREIYAQGSMSVTKGVIDSISPTLNAQSIHTFPATYHIVPGFIDMHTHGANGHDVMDATPEALAGISQALAAEGTTAFLATTMTASIADIEKALCNVRDFMQVQHEHMGATVLGVHLEGPFVASSKLGAQTSEHILVPDLKLMEHWQKLAEQVIKLVTLAPEQAECLDFIRHLKKHNIIASLGHTNASYEEAVAAIDAGCRHATHLFNAMRGIHHRDPGAVTAALLADNVMVELILDGIHLHPAIVELVLNMKGQDKILLVTDAMRAKCLQDGCYELGGQSVQVHDGAARLADGTLAGSVLSMSSAMQNMLKFTGCSLVEVIKMVSGNPARALGIFKHKGSLEVGKDADFVVLDAQMNVMMTVRGGRVVFDRCRVD